MTRNKKTSRKGLRIMLWLAAAAVAAYAGLVAWVYIQEISVPEPADYDSIIVLGAQVLPTGEPSVQLQWRLDKAMEYYVQNPCYVVTCGGQADREPEPEGNVMRRVMLAAGASDEHIISDPVSADTKQNIRNAWDILEKMGCKRPLIITSDYHLPRAMAIARDNGLDPLGAGSPCRPEINFWLKNHLREALAWVKYWLIKYVHLPL